jgi:hypothetical protein
MSTKTKFWIAGLIAAVAGVVLVRVVSGMFAEQVIVRLVIYFSGVALGLAGLLIIMAGIRKAR